VLALFISGNWSFSFVHRFPWNYFAMVPQIAVLFKFSMQVEIFAKMPARDCSAAEPHCAPPM